VLCPKKLEQVGDCGVRSHFDALGLTDGLKICVKCGVDSIHCVSWPRTLNKRIDVSQGALQDVAGDSWTASLNRKPIRTALSHLQKLSVRLGGPKMLCALRVLPRDTPEDGRLLERFSARKHRNEALPNGAAGELIYFNVQVAERGVELPMGSMCEIAKKSTFDAQVLMDNPVNLTASQLAHRPPQSAGTRVILGAL